MTRSVGGSIQELLENRRPCRRQRSRWTWSVGRPSSGSAPAREEEGGPLGRTQWAPTQNTKLALMFRTARGGKTTATDPAASISAAGAMMAPTWYW